MRAQCQQCDGSGNIFFSTWTIEDPHTHFETSRCPNCGGQGDHVKPIKPRQATTKTISAVYPPCPTCGQQVKILLWKDGSCYVDCHPTGPLLRDVCPMSMRDGTPFLKKEPRSVTYHRDLKFKRRLDAAIKKHDAAEARRKLEQLSYNLGGL